MYGECDPEHTAGYDLMSSCSSLNSEMSMGEILELLCILHTNVLFKRQTHTHTHTLYLTVVLYVHRFTNKNIIHKTPEWTLIAVVLLHL